MRSLISDRDTVIDELSAVLARVDEKDVEEFSRTILDADTVVVIGVGREGLAARGFAMRLMHAGLNAHWAWDDTAPALRAGDVLVIVSGSGEIGHIDYVSSQARNAGAKTAVMTANAAGATAAVADAVVVVPAGAYRAAGDLVPSIQPMGSLFEQSVQIVLDLIILGIMDRCGLTGDDLAANHRNFE